MNVRIVEAGCVRVELASRRMQVDTLVGTTVLQQAARDTRHDLCCLLVSCILGAVHRATGASPLLQRPLSDATLLIEPVSPEQLDSICGDPTLQAVFDVQYVGLWEHFMGAVNDAATQLDSTSLPVCAQVLVRMGTPVCSSPSSIPLEANVWEYRTRICCTGAVWWVMVQMGRLLRQLDGHLGPHAFRDDVNCIVDFLAVCAAANRTRPLRLLRHASQLQLLHGQTSIADSVYGILNLESVALHQAKVDTCDANTSIAMHLPFQSLHRLISAQLRDAMHKSVPFPSGRNCAAERFASLWITLSRGIQAALDSEGGASRPTGSDASALAAFLYKIVAPWLGFPVEAGECATDGRHSNLGISHKTAFHLALVVQGLVRDVLLSSVSEHASLAAPIVKRWFAHRSSDCPAWPATCCGLLWQWCMAWHSGLAPQLALRWGQRAWGRRPKGKQYVALKGAPRCRGGVTPPLCRGCRAMVLRRAEAKPGVHRSALLAAKVGKTLPVQKQSTL